ncbi:hypothetical protein CLAIMM_11475 [Cladophialophora immunda]|nr:hypothetical protein CLAIMM_11475 [Cladophialophora immunda]
MSQYPPFPNRDRFPNLKDQVVVITGGASGIGAALGTLAYRHGAHVMVGDINPSTGDTLVQTLQSNKPSSGANDLTFRSCDVCKYGDLYALFRAAHDKHGRVDHAVFCAGIVDSPSSSYFGPEVTIDSVGREPGDLRAVEINFMAACSFARVALPFLRRDAKPGQSNTVSRGSQPSPGPSLTLLSSVTGFRDAPGMFLYQTSKQAILGLMRALRTVVFARDGIRVNAVCPGMTDTPMTSGSGLIDLFKHRTQEDQAKLPSHYQSANAVAEHIAAILLTDGLNGKSIYVEEGKGWDFEDGLFREMSRCWAPSRCGGRMRIWPFSPTALAGPDLGLP